MVKKKTKKKGGKEFQPVKLDGTVRFVRSNYHARCPDGVVIPCVIGWFGDQLGLPYDAFKSGAIVENYDEYDDLARIREQIHERFKIDDETMEELQRLNDEGYSDDLAQALIENGIVDPSSKFEIELVNPEPEDGPAYVSLDE